MNFIIRVYNININIIMKLRIGLINIITVFISINSILNILEINDSIYSNINLDLETSFSIMTSNGICITENLQKEYLEFIYQNKMMSSKSINSTLLNDYLLRYKLKVDLISSQILDNNVYMKCFCFKGYTTINIHSTFFPKKLCNYPQKLKIVAIIIEGLIGYGVGHLYVGRTFHFLIKFLICFILYMTIQILISIKEDVNERFNNIINLNYETIIKYLVTYISYIIYLWQFIDSLLFYLGIYKDGNSIDLY